LLLLLFLLDLLERSRRLPTIVITSPHHRLTIEGSLGSYWPTLRLGGSRLSTVHFWDLEGLSRRKGLDGLEILISERSPALRMGDTRAEVSFPSISRSCVVLGIVCS
jgi:hypothetical protein